MNIVKQFLIFTLLFILPASLSATPKIKTTETALAVFFTVKGDVQEKYNLLMEKKIREIGFNLTDPHKRVNDHYKTEFGSTVLDVLSFMPVVNDKVILPLLNIDPRIAGFAPFNMLIEKKLDEENTHVGHLMPNVMLDILGIKNKEVRDKFTASIHTLDTLIAQEIGGEKSYIPIKKLPEQTMMNFEYSFDIPDEMEDFIDEFQEKFETVLTDKKYLVAGYHNFMESTDNAKEILKNYDAFWTYSLCHMEFSYNIFDKKDARPDAGLFAPCTMYMYIPKGSGKLIIGMYRLHNWSDTLGIDDEQKVSLVEKLDRELPEILVALGAKASRNINTLTQPKAEEKVQTSAVPAASAKVEKKTSEKITLAKMYIIEGDAQKEYNTLVEKEILKTGFNMADPHHRVNDQYKEKYGSTQLDVLSFLPAVNDDVVMKLFNTDPRLAGFSPFNMLIYKKLTDKVTHVGHLMPEAMLDILGITDKKVKKSFTDSFIPLDEMMESYFKAKNLNYTVEYIPYHNSSTKKMLNYEYTFERPEDLDDFIEEFQNRFELAFIDKDYLIAGFHNFMDNDSAEEILEGFDAFWSYSLCHLTYSYNIFDTDNARPDAGLYAPCTMYVYILKDSNKLVLGMPTLANVKNTLAIKNGKRIKWMDRLDREIPEILTSMDMIAVENVNPLKESPKPLKVEIKDPKKEQKHAVKRTNKREPEEEEKVQNSNTNIGEVGNGKISAYLRGKFIDVKTAQTKLEEAGFEIVSVTPVNKKGTLISIVFTDKALIKMASKTNRGFMASLRLLVNKKEKHISITNPLYLAKAFMQEDFDETAAKGILEKITTHFTGLINSKDVLKFQLLPKYQFMNGMPKYQDMTVVSIGSDLIEKAKKNKKVVFIQKLDNGATLIGVQLGKRTQKFTGRIGTNNAGLLPYPILIENNEAKILDPKYYISVMYPLLQMAEFMTIATVPGAIVKDCQRIFK